MPETRYERIEHYRSDEQGGGLINVDEIAYEVSDEELAEEQERNLMAKAEQMIDGISNLPEAKIFLKKLCKRLFKNGALP